MRSELSRSQIVRSGINDNVSCCERPQNLLEPLKTSQLQNRTKRKRVFDVEAEVEKFKAALVGGRTFPLSIESPTLAKTFLLPVPLINSAHLGLKAFELRPI